ncbi:MAG TPA: hypothetical protein EYH34_14100 [Planctomycetes bacterium]|nr:hypothetical protein [Planctomycetota bacterium]
MFVWDVAEERTIAAASFSFPPGLIDVAPDVGLAAVCPAAPSSGVELWKLKTCQPESQLPIAGWIHCVALSPDGKRVAVKVTVGGQQEEIEIWDVASGSKVAAWPHEGYVARMLFSPDGRWLAINESYSETRVLDLQDGSLTTLGSPESFRPLRPLAFSPEVNLLLVADHLDGGVRLWDVDAGKPVGDPMAQTLITHGSWLRPTGAWSPDGRYVAVAGEDEVSLWDTRTYRRVRTLSRSRRGMFTMVFSASIMGWAIAWGRVTRRRRRREAAGQPQGAEPLLLAPAVQLVLHPVRAPAARAFRTFALVGLVTLVVITVVADAWGLYRLWDLAWLFVVVGIVLFGLKWLSRPAAWLLRLRFDPHAAEVKRASRAAGWRTGCRHFGPVRAYFFGASQIVPRVEREFEAVRERFSEVVGHPVEPRERLLILGFKTYEDFFAYTRGYFPTPGYYVAERTQQIALCAQAALDRAMEPVYSLRVLMALYFLDQYKGFLPPPWLQLVVSHAVAGGLEEGRQRQVHRALRLWQQRDPAAREPGLVALSRRQALRVICRSYERRSFRQTACWTWEMTSLAQYLLADPTGHRPDAFRGFLRTLRLDEPIEGAFVRHFGYGWKRLIGDWHAWALEQPIEPHDEPPPLVEQHLKRSVLPVVACGEAPMPLRAEAIRHLGAGGYLTGVETLIDVLDDDRARPLHEEALWALEVIAGRSCGQRAAGWHQWYDQVRLDEPPAPTREPVPAQTQPTAAVSPEPWATARAHTGRAGYQEPKPGGPAPAADETPGEVAIPGALTACWVLFILGGAVAIIWSVAVWLRFPSIVVGPSMDVVFAAYVLAGAFAVTRGTGAQVGKLKTAASLLVLTAAMGNVFSLAAGVMIHLLLRTRNMKRYLARVRV